jgi:hypothetical protein
MGIPPVQQSFSIQHRILTESSGPTEALGDRMVVEFAKLETQAHEDKSKIAEVANSGSTDPQELLRKQRMLHEYALKTSLAATMGKLAVTGIKQVVTTNG